MIERENSYVLHVGFVRKRHPIDLATLDTL